MNVFSNTASGSAWPSWTKSTAAGYVVDVTVTPAGGVRTSAVGKNAGSRGLFDWTWIFSGSATLSSSFALLPGRTAAGSAVGVSTAFGARVWAPSGGAPASSATASSPTTRSAAA